MMVMSKKEIMFHSGTCYFTEEVVLFHSNVGTFQTFHMGYGIGKLHIHFCLPPSNFGELKHMNG
jgi:hypothetical protein